MPPSLIPKKTSLAIATLAALVLLLEFTKLARPFTLAEVFDFRPRGVPALDCALSVRMIFTLPKPKSAPKRKRIYAMRKPDVSKLARSTEDALTTAMIWSDDSRVAEYSRLAKVYPGEDPESLKSPGVIIEITKIEGETHENDLFPVGRRATQSAARNVR